MAGPAGLCQGRTEKVSYRLAQQPGSYVVLKYIRKVAKRLETETILTAPTPANVLEHSAADIRRSIVLSPTRCP